MTTIGRRNEATIISREKELRDWFTHGKDELMREIDGLDIGWGASQRWATSSMPDIAAGWHLDFACGYGTFLAQVGWRFPCANLFGLNIDYTGPHACIKNLLQKAGVRATLIQADACAMPFADRCFDAVSCFLGLQDIKIGFGKKGVRKAVCEAVRVLKPGGYLTLVDEFALDVLLTILEKECTEVVLRDEFVLDIKWSRPVAEAAIEVYSEGWTAQSRVEGVRERATVRRKTYMLMKADMEQQIRAKGFYAPHGPVCMVVAKKI
jgi:ubiquinone/menaquinone biosynthesis C-methylase UbiE